MRAYFYDNSDLDPREAHDSGEPVSIEDLGKIKVYYKQLSGTLSEQLEIVNQLCEERGYKNRDEIKISPELLPGYEEKIKVFFTEHIHEDEEIRFVMEGRGFFDVRDQNDRWVRIAVEAGDLLIVPAGIYHRFTLDTGNYIHAMRLFQEEPKWTPINRPEADANPYHLDHLKTIDALEVGELNSKKQGVDIKRKNNCIVNTGGKLTRDEVEKRRREHRERFEVADEVWKNIVLPKADNPLLVLDRKREELKELCQELQRVQDQIAAMQSNPEICKGVSGTKRQRE
ncbi:1,2-dihydroxy-3-keto-5-methylthiopentene dioxygenase [Coemansia sp. Benny D115]|nr:1,2-dihydroxy-3-keto-5-methylthiopentene dioxygenase [Coemansia sp. Benny D115]